MVVSMRAAILLGAAGILLSGQSTRSDDLAAGKFLVASRDLGDPNFAESVVLLVRYDEDAVLGLIVNRPSNVRLSRLSEQLKSAKGRQELIYEGGPVGKSGILALNRARTKLQDADHVFGDVYLVSSKEQLEKSIAASSEASPARVYLGSAGWTGAQLQREVELGAWYIFKGDADVLFDPNPEAVWQRLIRRTEQRVAGTHSPERLRLSGTHNLIRTYHTSQPVLVHHDVLDGISSERVDDMDLPIRRLQHGRIRILAGVGLENQGFLPRSRFIR
jgi:putative transcriptional regulator